MIQTLGWLSSLILVATLVTQIRKQWKAGSSEGVSKWLFVGQLSASVGFCVYSVLTGSIIFTITNGILVINSLVGLGLTLKQRAGAAAGE